MKTGKRSTGSVKRQEIGGHGRLRRRRKAARLGAGERLEDRRLLVVSLDMAPVGNPGNVADTTGYGAVAYPYQIGKHEVTIGQYAEFLNAVAKTDTYGLYATGMASNYGGVGITRSGSSGAYSYTVNTVSTFAYGPTTVGPNLPITDVNWFDAARFANWMANGQPTGAQGNTTTEQGAYALAGATSGNTVARSSTNPNTGVAPTFFIPTENEWYKAAYYSPALNGGSGGYFTYATRSNSYPGNSSTTGANMANVNTGVYATSQQAELVSGVVYMTNVGLYANSGSFYGTFDQSGNVTELSTLAGGASPNVAMRGGNWTATPSAFSDSGNRSEVGTTFATYNIGFRLAAPATAPGQPTGLSGAPGAGQVSLTWNAPASNGGALITDYVVEYKTTAAATWTTFADGVSTTPAAIVTGLTNGTSYVFRVSAKNEAGTGNPTAASASVTPRTVPDAPVVFSASRGDGLISLSWDAPASNGGSAVTDYVVEYKTTTALTWTTFPDGVSTQRQATVTGLTNGAAYLFRVSAKNAAGTGTASEYVQATPATVPGVPTDVIVTADRGRALVTWSAPSFDGGSPITGYSVEWGANGSGWAGTSTDASARSLHVSTLVEGSPYSFRVCAVNSMGQGNYSSYATVTTPREPGFPVRGGGAGTETVGGMATVAGATLVTGSFSGTATFGGTTLTSAGGTDIYVAKLNADGTYAWAVRAGGTNDDYAYQVAALGDGSLLVTGSFQGTAAFGGTSLVSGGYDAFVARLNANGSFAWARSLGNTGNSIGTAVAALANGTAVVTGWFSGSATFGTMTLTSEGSNSDAFVAKLDAAGSVVWATRAGTSFNPFPGFPGPSVNPSVIAILPDGSAHVAGAFSGGVQFGDTSLGDSMIMDRRIFVAKVDAFGSFAWAKQFSTPSSGAAYYNEATGIAALADGSLLVTGRFSGTLDVGGTSLTSGSGSSVDTDGFVAKLGANGSVAWAVRAGGFNDDTITGITPLADGSALVTGTFDDEATFGGTMPPTMPTSTDVRLTGGDGDMFVAKIDASGSFVWASRAGGAGAYAQPAGIARLSDGSAMIAGRFTGVAAFGGVGIVSAGDWDMFVARVLADGSFDLLAGRPTDVTGIPGNASVALTWTAPGYVGAGAVSDYKVEYSGDGGTTWSTFADGVSTAASATVTGLTNGTAYIFRVSAINSAGTGRPSDRSEIMTPTLAKPSGWPKRGGSAGEDAVLGLVAFGDGSATVAGWYNGATADFGRTTLVSLNNPNGSGGQFVARLDADGTYAWASQVGGSVVAAAANGDTIVAGTRYTTIPAGYFAGMYYSDRSVTQMVVTRLAADGSRVWTSTAGADAWTVFTSPNTAPPDSVEPAAAATLADGSAIVAGRFTGTAAFGSTILTANSTSLGSMFVAKLNADGSYAWAQAFSEPTFNSVDISGVATLADGSSIITGSFSNTISFGSAVLSASGQGNFVVKLSAVGAVVWAQQVGAGVSPGPSGITEVHDVVPLAGGSLLLAGGFSGSVMFGGTQYDSSGGSNDAFVAKLNADGSLAWVAVESNSAASSTGYGLAALSDGSALVTGEFSGTATFGGTTLTSAGDSDVFIAKVTAGGAFAWARRAGGSGNDSGKRLAGLADGTALVAGTFEGTAAFGSASLTSVAATDTFIAKIGADGAFVVPGTATTVTVGTGQTVTDTTVRTGTAQLVKQGIGTLILDLANSHSGGTVVDAGDVVVRNTGALGTGTVMVKPGARLMLDVGPQSVPLAGLQIQGGGLLDVGTGRMVLGAGTFDLAAIRGQLAAGHGAGTGPGSSGIASGAAAATPGRAVGHAFDGEGNLVVGFAAFGDLNLDGVADFDDILAFISAGRFDSGQPGTWDTGDFDYNGVVDFDDVLAMVSAGQFDQGPYLPSQSVNTAAFEPAQAMFDRAAAAFASLGAQQQATSDTSARKKQTVRIG